MTTDSSKNVTLHEKALLQGTVPDVTGMGLRDAVYIIESAGMQVQIIGRGAVTITKHRTRHTHRKRPADNPAVKLIRNTSLIEDCHSSAPYYPVSKSCKQQAIWHRGD